VHINAHSLLSSALTPQVSGSSLHLVCYSGKSCPQRTQQVAQHLGAGEVAVVKQKNGTMVSYEADGFATPSP
jgi:hypothetical protein